MSRSRLSPSSRLAVLAFALSTWFEGYSSLRHSVTQTAFFDTQIISLSLTFDSNGDEIIVEQESTGRDVEGRPSAFQTWLTGRGRKLDNTERTAMGAADVLVSLAILRLIKAGPLFPFLITPLLTAIPLPRNQKRVGHIRWSKITLVSLALCILRQLQRVFIANGVGLYRHLKDERDGVYKGRVIVRGSPLAPPQQRRPQPPSSQHSASGQEDLSWMYESENDEDEAECIICAGHGGAGTGNADMSQSVSSLSSSRASDSGAPGAGYSFGALPTGASSSSTNLGPLEAFCTRAPTKHVAHRICILRWHAAYNDSQRQRRGFRIPGLDSADDDDIVDVREESASTSSEPAVADSQRKLRRARSLLQSAGFEYLLDSLRSTRDRERSSTSPITPRPTFGVSPVGTSSPSQSSATSPPFTPSFTLANPPNQNPKPSSPLARSSTSTNSTGSIPPTDHLGTLRTEWPPCPGCRSPIDLHFCAAPPRVPSASPSSRTSPSSSFSAYIPLPISHLIKRLQSVSVDLKKNTTQLVTGRAILLSLFAQFSFIVTTVSMLRAKERYADYENNVMSLARNAKRASSQNQTRSATDVTPSLPAVPVPSDPSS